MITFKNNLFHLKNENYSYVILLRGNRLHHVYFSIPLNEDNFNLINDETFPYFNNDSQLFEIGERGRGDFRIPSIEVENGETLTTDFKFKSYKIINNLDNYIYPHVRNIKETLKIEMYDNFQELTLELYYSLALEGLVTKARIINKSDKVITLKYLASGMLDLPIDEYSITDLNGRWGNEFIINKQIANKGIYNFNSSRGVTSHQHNPFLVIGNKDINEDYGIGYGLALIYSGNFKMEVEVDEKNQLRVTSGINIIGKGIELKNDKEFITPELIMIPTFNGYHELSHKFHNLIRRDILNPNFKNKDLPIVLNTWESFYFDINEEKIKDFILKAKGLGFTTIVMDDGWFKGRVSDHFALGDWTIDEKKFKDGFDSIIKLIKECGMKFGLWFEPEAISPISDLYKNHNDYAIENSKNKGLELRNQYVIDFSKKAVVDYIYSLMKDILDRYDISYIKRDMNRPLSDTYNSKQYVDYVKGVYYLYDLLTKNYPDILIEGCSSGGGRFDLGILYYSPIIWTSDDTDAFKRMQIEYGASFLYPLKTLSNHVSICPNHQTNRVTPFNSRGAVASLGTMGYELNLSKLSNDEIEDIKIQINNYKLDKDLICDGDIYRLKNPMNSNTFSIEVVSKDKEKVYVVYSNILVEPNLPLQRLKLKGLLKNKDYYIKELDLTVNSNLLINLGLNIEMEMKDFNSVILHLDLVK